jgi:Sir2- and TIR-associating SLOG family/SIR2-like domain
MNVNKREFVKRYSQWIEKGSAAAFIGAGVSISAGYPSWRTLLADVAKELGLDIEKEHDLAGIAQYYLNRFVGNRFAIGRIIRQHFPAPVDVPPALRVLARMPIRTIWTTNYDKLIERAWELQDKQLEVKSRNQDLAFDDPWAHAVLYKMHGTVDHPGEVVLAKNDYELYRRERQGFHQLLIGNLISKHFVFLGFSFTDPNLSYVFGLIREAFHGETAPEHYAIVKTPERKKGRNAQTAHEYEINRHQLWMGDLNRYGITCVEVSEYEEIEELLIALEKQTVSRSVFVSGSFPERDNDTERLKIEEVASSIGELVAKRGLRLVSGFGLVVGRSTISGAVEGLYDSPRPNLERSLYIRPFPQKPPKKFSAGAFLTRYREDLVSKAGVAIFLGGLKTAPGGGTEVAVGVLEEFTVSASVGCLPIPLGATGGAALKIWGMVSRQYHKFYGTMPRKHFDRLNDKSLSISDLTKSVEKILDWAAQNR